jgi:hypothetical protein
MTPPHEIPLAANWHLLLSLPCTPIFDKSVKNLISDGFGKSVEIKACKSREMRRNADIGLFTEPSILDEQIELEKKRHPYT